jgi:uroporphyrinogen-III synthase
LLKEFCDQHAIELIAKSLIRFELVHNEPMHETEVIFFSSIRAAEFYLAQHFISPSTEIATIGSKTADKLRELGLTVSFIGSTAGDPEKVGIEFKSWLNGRSVTIPCSDRTNRSIAYILPEDQVKELIVYKTVANPLQIPPCDLYIFSSPSNLEAFCETNSFPEKSATIAWGKTTEQALVNRGIKPIKVLSTSSEQEIVDFLQTKK